MQVRSTLLLQLKKIPVIPSATGAAGDLFLCEDHESTTRIGEWSFGDPSTAALSLRAAWGGRGSGNPVDDCWRCDPNWAAHHQSLANCAIVFGRNAIGGKNGRIYVVTSPADDHVVNPRPGTLRYALTRLEPLWSKYKTFFLYLHTCPPAGDQTIAHEYAIQSCNNELLQLIRLLLLLLGMCLTIIFARSLTIRRRNEGIMMSYKRLDGRGVIVHITSGASLTLQSVNHTIIHNIYIHDIVANGPARVMSSGSHVGQRGRADGDAISIFTANNMWMDHCSLAKDADGLIDAIRGSTFITISNNYFMNHDMARKQP
ncbi:unnamed protein product [Sphagnum tenellum]